VSIQPDVQEFILGQRYFTFGWLLHVMMLMVMMNDMLIGALADYIRVNSDDSTSQSASLQDEPL